jgi:hypothetical protein
MNSASDVLARGFRAIESVDLLAGGVGRFHRARFSIDGSTRIGSTGGDFAYHVIRCYRQRNFCIIDEEPPPSGMADASARRFGYRLHSARHGNIGTVRQLRQLVEETLGHFKPADAIWQKGDRYYDAMRPTVEPGGLSTPELVADHRAHHLGKVKRVLESSDVLQVTLDTTESWEHEPSGTVYPVAPGAVAGSLNPAIHQFRSFTFQEVYDDLTAFFALCKTINPAVRFLLTVSPKPLVEISGIECSLSSTGYSKSVLRAVAGQLYRERSDVDYLPVYELATFAQPGAGILEDDLQDLAPGWTRTVTTPDMAHTSGDESSAHRVRLERADDDDDAELERMLGSDSLCEEILDETFKP